MKKERDMYEENPIRKSIVEDLEKIQLIDEWQQFTNACRDQSEDFKELLLSSPWGKIINEKKVFVVVSYEGKTHSAWKLFVDGVFIRDMNEIAVHMGSARNAMLIAEKEVGGSEMKK